MTSTGFRILFSIFIFANSVVSSAQTGSSSLAENSGLQRRLAGISAGDTIYLNVEEDETQEVFSAPGFDSENCQNDSQCMINARLTRNANLTWLGHSKQIEMTKFNDYSVNVTFLDVKYSYVDPKTYKEVKGTGWMSATRLDKEKKAPVYQTTPDKDQNSCPANLAQISKAVYQETEAEFNKRLNTVVDQLLPYFGRCPFSNPRELIKHKIPAQQLVYENKLLPMLSRTSYPTNLSDGSQLSFQDFLKIDAYSRDNIGEMGRCFDKGLEYPMAEQALLINRAEFVDKANEKKLPELAAIFVRENHKDYSNDVKVATEPIQISLWNNYQNGKNLNGIGQALCPPSNPDKEFWTNFYVSKKHTKKKMAKSENDSKKKIDPNQPRKPIEDEYNIWKQAVKIAVEAVLFRPHFKARVKELEDLFHYTSSGATIKGLEPVKGLKVNGKYLTDTDCIRVWHDPKMDTALKKLSSP